MERTLLAWVRTGLAFGAVALAVGKIVPEVSHSSSQWAYGAIGVGYALLGVLVIVYALIRREDLEDALNEGGYAPASATLLTLVLIGSALLGVAIAAVIMFGRPARTRAAASTLRRDERRPRIRSA